MSKLEAYRDLASLGIQTSVVSHEVSQDLSNLISLSEIFERGLSKNSLSKKELFEIQSDMSSSVRFIRDYMSLVKNFTITLKADQIEFRKKTKFNMNEEIEFYKNRMGTLFERNNIDFINLIPKESDIYMYRADFQSIIFNLISNSIKAIIRRRNTMNPYKKSTYRNKIKIKSLLTKSNQIPSDFCNIEPKRKS